MVQLKEKTTMPNEMEYTFHLGFVAYQKDELDVIDDSAMQLVSIVAQPHSDIPKCYTKLMRLIEFDTFVATHGPGTEVDGEHNDTLNPFSILSNNQSFSGGFPAQTKVEWGFAGSSS